MPHINAELLDLSSSFLGRVSPDEIEAERQRIEAEQGRTVRVWQVEHSTRHGVDFTRITWEVI